MEAGVSGRRRAGVETTVAGSLLLVVGALIIVLGIYTIVVGFLASDAMGYGSLTMIVGGLLVTFGALNVFVGRSLRKQLSWAVPVAAATAAPGALLGVYVLPSALTPVFKVVDQATMATVLAPNDVAIIIAAVGAAYVFVLAFLVLAAFQARRSTRQDASRPNP